jgi:tRNA A-37 threonylcarbamoyl transferase component Bud32/predicted nucleotidyltransferase
MRSLEETDEKKLINAILPLTRNRQIIASCVYGSQVAGYARKSSDYDLIVVLHPFSQKIKYYYLKGEVDCSVLAVSSRSFENDCAKSSLGEFVAGRLLNPYKALSNQKFLFECEVEFKKRVILEGLHIAYSEVGPFIDELEMGIEYFLFEKLRRRAAIYPPVIYSYAQTYGLNLREKNSESALTGFREAARQLELEGIVHYFQSSDKVKIKKEAFKRKHAEKLSLSASYTAIGLRQYAVHGYAGRVRPDVVGREIMSKLSRSKQHKELPDFISYPKIFWDLPDTKLFPETTDWMGDILLLLKMDRENTQISNSGLGEIYSSARFFTLRNKSKSVAIAIKRYNDIRGMKWGVLSIWSFGNANFSVGAVERLYREYRASRIFRQLGIKTAEVLAVFLSERMLVTSFVQGRDLSAIETDYLNGRSEELRSITQFGKVLAKLHKSGFCMGDSKPSNAILCDVDREIYLTDLEQAHEQGNPAWDIAEFIYYSLRFTLKENRAIEVVNAFVSGYLEEGGSKVSVRDIIGFRYTAPFQAFIAPNVLNSVKRELSSR